MKPNFRMDVDRMVGRRPNLSEIAYEEIRDMIFSGVLAQGERIILDRISEKLKLSITPVREALNKLVQDEIVLAMPRSGYQVVSLQSDDVEDIMDLRENLETFAMRTAGENLSSFPVSSFRDLFKKLSANQNHRKFVEADGDFHASIVGLSKNKRLRKLFNGIRDHERLLMVPAAKIKGRVSVAIEEHLSILDAIEQKDIALIMQRLSSHIQNVKALLLETE